MHCHDPFSQNNTDIKCQSKFTLSTTSYPGGGQDPTDELRFCSNTTPPVLGVIL